MTDLNALRYTPEHEWIAVDGDIATFGITDYAADKLGDIVFVELPTVASSISAGQVCGEIESTKSVGEVFAPIDGEVTKINEAVAGNPSLINEDPFGDGWLVQVRIDVGSLNGFLDRAEYVSLTGDEV